MPMYSGTPGINTCIIQKDGKHFTQVWKGGIIVRIVETHPSQVRKPRSSKMYHHADDEVILGFGKHNNVSKSSFSKLVVEEV